MLNSSSITLQSIVKTPKTGALWKWYHKGSHFKIRANFYQVPISFSVTIYSNSMELKSMQQHSQNNSTVLVFQKYPPEVINSAVTPYNHLSSKKAKKNRTSMYDVQKVFKGPSFSISLVFLFTLTCLTWLIHTSVLPSNWNPDKMFAPTGLLGQVHTVKKIFLKFLHAGAIFF